jgi:hypothetical protein
MGVEAKMAADSRASLPVSIFDRLSRNGKEKRAEVTKDLLQRLSNNPCGFEYTLKRLICGLLSSAGVARQGFAAALCAILREFEDQIVTEQLLELFDKYISFDTLSGRQDRKDLLFGRIFSSLVLVRSGRVPQITLNRLTSLVSGIVQYSDR